MLGHLDGAQDVGNRRQAEVDERARDCLRQAEAAGKVVTPDLGVEDGVEAVGGLIRDADHEVGVHDVVDQRHVLVADALDVVLAVAVVEQGRALDGFDDRDLGAVLRLEVVASRERAGRTAGRHVAGEARALRLLLQGEEDRLERRTRATPVRQIVAEFAELVDDLVGGIARQLGALVVDLLDVGLGAGRAHDVLRAPSPIFPTSRTAPGSCLRAARPHRGSQGCAIWRRRRGSSCRSRAILRAAVSDRSGRSRGEGRGMRKRPAPCGRGSWETARRSPPRCGPARPLAFRAARHGPARRRGQSVGRRCTNARDGG